MKESDKEHLGRDGLPCCTQKALLQQRDGNNEALETIHPVSTLVPTHMQLRIATSPRHALYAPRALLRLLVSINMIILCVALILTHHISQLDAPI